MWQWGPGVQSGGVRGGFRQPTQQAGRCLRHVSTSALSPRRVVMIIIVTTCQACTSWNIFYYWIWKSTSPQKFSPARGFLQNVVNIFVCKELYSCTVFGSVGVELKRKSEDKRGFWTRPRFRGRTLRCGWHRSDFLFDGWIVFKIEINHLEGNIMTFPTGFWVLVVTCPDTHASADTHTHIHTVSVLP